MSDDLVKRLRKATFTKGKMRGGAGGQTIEASMRSTFHEISAWDLEKAADEIERLRAKVEAERDEARLLLDEAAEALSDAATEIANLENTLSDYRFKDAWPRELSKQIRAALNTEAGHE